MSNYIFRFPAGTPAMTYGGLMRYVSSHHGPDEVPIGKTVRVRIRRPGGPGHEVIDVYLYGTRIARLTQHGAVTFGRTDDPHLATTEWVSRIVRDNGLGNRAWRIRRRKADGPGPQVRRGHAGLLTIDGDRRRPVFGHLYQARQEVPA
jgi:hypothetical protein